MSTYEYSIKYPFPMSNEKEWAERGARVKREYNEERGHNIIIAITYTWRARGRDLVEEIGRLDSYPLTRGKDLAGERAPASVLFLWRERFGGSKTLPPSIHPSIFHFHPSSTILQYPINQIIININHGMDFIPFGRPCYLGRCHKIGFIQNMCAIHRIYAYTFIFEVIDDVHVHVQKNMGHFIHWQYELSS
jgi:hypothetical protein